MNITVRAYESTGVRCRHCKVKARWRVARPNRYGDDSLCDQHLGLSLRNLGLRRLRDRTHRERVRGDRAMNPPDTRIKYEWTTEYREVRGVKRLNALTREGWRFVAVVNGMPTDARYLMEKRVKRATYVMMTSA